MDDGVSVGKMRARPWRGSRNRAKGKRHHRHQHTGKCGRHLVLGGSANLRSSLNIEQITIDNDPAIYKFHRDWMSNILNNYHVNHVMLRREALWQQVAKNAEPEKQGVVTARRN